jgi:aerobic-type carbon monoxide dehydrogenase small subunit (CoxS/CutS family)
MAEEKVNKISRREFLKDAGLVVGGATIGSMTVLSACGGDTKTVTETINTTKTITEKGTNSTVTVTAPAITVTASAEESASIKTVHLTINGEKHERLIDVNTTLQELLHDILGYISVKDWCLGNGACGSCSVIVNGRPVLSCLTLAALCDNATIETAEGIGKDKHPIIDAMVTNQAIQCGYCAPGFVVTAKALLDRQPDPTEDQIREALGGNLCRCGTYQRLIPAVQTAAATLKGGE